VNSDFKLFNVKIPSFIDKIDLYSIASSYKALNISEILLINKNCILKEDESSFDSISEGDLIIIIENRIYPDDSYYKSLLTKNQNCRVTNVRWKDSLTTSSVVLQFPPNITISQMKKAIYLKFGYNKKQILSNWIPNKYNDNETLEDIYDISLSYEKAQQILNWIINFFGKKIEIEIEKKVKRKNQPSVIVILGTLNTNKLLVKRIEADLQEKVKKIYFNEKELDIKNEMSIASLGIKNGSLLTVVTEEQEH
jgi:hypothetical protein